MGERSEEGDDVPGIIHQMVSPRDPTGLAVPAQVRRVYVPVWCQSGDHMLPPLPPPSQAMQQHQDGTGRRTFRVVEDHLAGIERPFREHVSFSVPYTDARSRGEDTKGAMGYATGLDDHITPHHTRDSHCEKSQVGRGSSRLLCARSRGALWGSTVQLLQPRRGRLRPAQVDKLPKMWRVAARG